jgi:type VI secretion system VasD/TssJ family lipoprotein
MRTLTAAAALLLTGCPPPWHSHPWVEVLLRTGTPLNPDEQGVPRPLQIRLYLLKDDARFLASTPTDLALNDRVLLESDLISSKDLTLAPGASDQRPVQANLGECGPEARFVGVLALYPGRRADGETWHAVVDADHLHSIAFTFRNRTLTLAGY